MTLGELKELLGKSKVPYESWGTGASRTIEDLLNEINSGDCFLHRFENGELIRFVSVASANVFYHKGDVVLRLVEGRQEFPDGRSRTRDSSRSSLNEKIRRSEDQMSAIRRGVLEELGVDSDLAKIDYASDTIRTVKTDQAVSYPGIMTQFTYYDFVVTLQDESFKAEGYVEEGKLKTFFVWEQVAVSA